MKYTLICFAFFAPLLLSGQKKNTNTPTQDRGYSIEEIDPNYGIFINLHSDTMQKDFPVLVFLPADYEKNKQVSYPVFYLLHGANGQPLTEQGVRKLYGPNTGVQLAADVYNVIIVCPLVGNKLYVNSPLQPKDKYATLIAIELTNFIDKKFRTIPNRDHRFIGGFSMGGYGGISLLCRYPEVYSVGLSRGGVMDIASLIDDLHWDEPFGAEIFGDYWSQQKNYHLNSILNLLNKVKDRKDVGIVIEVGRDDFLYLGNKKVEQKLKSQGYNYIFAEYPGGHVWNKNSLNSMFTHLQYFKNTMK